MAITIYTTPNCSQCDGTKRQFDRAGVSYDVVELQANPELLAEFKARGLNRAPIVQSDVEGAAEWTGLRPDLIRKVVKAHGTTQAAPVAAAA